MRRRSSAASSSIRRRRSSGIGAAIGLPFAGVLIVEATKQLYRPVGVRRVARREALALPPGLAPVAHRAAGGEPLTRRDAALAF